MKLMVLKLTALILLASGTMVAGASAVLQLIIRHQGGTNPTMEKFCLWPDNGDITAMRVDDGPAWQIANGLTPPQQALYIQTGGIGPYCGGSGLTQRQIDDINGSGFLASVRARIIDGPAWDAAGKVSAFISVAGFGPRRWDIGLASDGQGNTLVVLPSDVSEINYTYFSYTPFNNPPLLLTGTNYHLYQLSYSPITQTASLFVDSVQQVTGYQGATVDGGTVNSNYGLAFGSVNTGTARFAASELNSGQF